MNNSAYDNNKSDQPEKIIKTKKTAFKVNYDLYSEEDFLKDCPNYQFVPTIMPAAKRIIVMGDIHGDFNLTIQSFKLAKLIDDKLNWIANPPDTIVVQVGDQIDSCRPIPGVYDCHNKPQPGDLPEDMTIIDFFNQMHQKASEQGGAVYSLLGNHELMNADGRFEYVSHANYYDFSYENLIGTTGRKNAFKPGGPVANILACTRNSVIIIGSNMFVHAGILPKLAERLDHLNIDNNTKLKYLNAIVRKWLLNKLSNYEDMENKKLFIDDVKLSPFWTRIYGTIPENTNLNSSECFNTVKKIIEVFKIGQIVIGHTPQLFTLGDGINGTCYEKGKKNKLYRVDGGFSRAFKIFENNDIIQVLEIIDDNKFNIIRDTTIHKYAQPKPILDINERELKKIASIYAQNRISSPTSQNSNMNSSEFQNEISPTNYIKQKRSIKNFRNFVY